MDRLDGDFVVGGRLNWMIGEVFSNFGDPMIMHTFFFFSFLFLKQLCMNTASVFILVEAKREIDFKSLRMLQVINVAAIWPDHG